MPLGRVIVGMMKTFTPSPIGAKFSLTEIGRNQLDMSFIITFTKDIPVREKEGSKSFHSICKDR